MNKSVLAFVILAVLGLALASIMLFTEDGGPGPQEDSGRAAPTSPAPESAEAKSGFVEGRCLQRDTSKADLGRYSLQRDICVTGVEPIDELVKTALKNGENQFMTVLGNPDVMAVSAKSSLKTVTSEYSLDANPHMQSILMTMSMLIGGQKQPGITYRTWTFDRRTGRTYELEDIFAGSDVPLSKLYEAVRQQLAGLDGSNPFLFERGTGSGDPANYRHFCFDADRLVFFFPAGRVASEELGLQVATVPIDDIRDLLKPAILYTELSGADEDEGEGEGGEEPTGDLTAAALSCEENRDSSWLPAHLECEYASQDWCDEWGGEFEECASACRHEEGTVVCTLQCVPTCSF